MTYRNFLSLCLLLLFSSPAYAKHALLVGVTKYEHAALNETQLRFPEDDAKAIGEALTAHGYEVKVLVGSQATQQAIRTAMEQVAKHASGEDTLILGFFGHGVQYDESAYFCPYDTDLRVATDIDGKTLRSSNGTPLLEPIPKNLVSMQEMIDAMTITKAHSKLLLADCCREAPSRARGFTARSASGESLQANQLPLNCASLFACSDGQQSFEHEKWQHGAFTRALLDVLEAKQASTANELSALLYRSVNELVADSVFKDSKQTVSIIIHGLVDLQLTRK